MDFGCVVGYATATFSANKEVQATFGSAPAHSCIAAKELGFAASFACACGDEFHNRPEESLYADEDGGIELAEKGEIAKALRELVLAELAVAAEAIEDVEKDLEVGMARCHRASEFEVAIGGGVSPKMGRPSRDQDVLARTKSMHGPAHRHFDLARNDLDEFVVIPMPMHWHSSQRFHINFDRGPFPARLA